MEKEEFEQGGQVVKIPVSVIEEIVSDALKDDVTDDCDVSCNVKNALHRLTFKWSVIYMDTDAILRTAGFADYDDCASFVAKHYNTTTEIKYVLREGTPRKNVKVQVKARL